MKTFETICMYLFVASVIFVGCYPLYMYWRIYQLYKLAGQRVERIGFLWFAVYIQSPRSPRSISMLEGLPQNIQEQVTAFRLRTTRVHVGVALWIVFLILFGFLVNRILSWVIAS